MEWKGEKPMDTAASLLTTQQVSAQDLAANVQRILEDLSKNRFENSSPARLIAVTKTVAPDVINLLKPLNILDIGENRAQVAMPKMPQIEEDFRLHWIGRLQTNKVKYIIDSVCMLHTLDRLALAQEVQRRAAEHGRIIPALVQVNVSGEEQKGGMPPQEVLPFLKQMRDFGNIHIEGLMSIMPARAPEEELTRLFRQMRQLFDHLRQEAVDGVEMRELSMGMSGDYAIAAREGATMVRIGTALYQPLKR